ncbi:hypothetical protein GCM10027429_03690 [Marivirga atlantica]|jgi:hypothetical protein
MDFLNNTFLTKPILSVSSVISMIKPRNLSTKLTSGGFVLHIKHNNLSVDAETAEHLKCTVIAISFEMLF